MKKFFIAALAITTLASCTQDSVIDSAKNAIAFDNTFIDNAVRSYSDPSFTEAKQNLNDFTVYGFVEGATLFDKVQVSKTITNNELKSAWKYQGTQYWVAGADYNFAALAPYANDCASTAAVVAENAITTTLTTFTNDGVTDLLYDEAAPVMGKAEGNDKVAFSFRHILSKVKFSFGNAYNASNATITVSNIKITDAYKTANATLTDNATTWTAQAGSLELAFGHAIAADATENTAAAYAFGTTLESYNELLLIPSASREYTVTFDVNLFVNGTQVNDKPYAHTAKVTFAPEAGKCYDILAVIKPENIDPDHEQEPIEFTVSTLPGWGTVNNVEGDDVVDVPTTPAQ